MKNIAISGKITSGKDALADKLISLIGKSKKIAFADRLKKICETRKLALEERDEHYVELCNELWAIYGFSFSPSSIGGKLNSIFNEFPEEIHVPKPRRILQEVGNGLRKMISPDVWIRLLTREVRKLNESEVRVIVPDIRYRNEADALREAGFYLIRIQIGHDEQMRRYHEIYGEPDKNKLNHISETDLDDYAFFDMTLFTDSGDMEERWSYELLQIIKMFVVTEQCV